LIVSGIFQQLISGHETPTTQSLLGPAAGKGKKWKI